MKPMICPHEDFFANVDVNRLADSGRFVADIRIRCEQCGEPFHFLGILERGLLISAPATSVDGLELHVPIGPGRLELEGSSRFEYPRELIRMRTAAKLAADFLTAIRQGATDDVTRVRQELAAALKEVGL